MTSGLKINGLRHVALCVADLEACEHFYIDLLGYSVEWKPDADNVYLTSGADNLALHRVAKKREGGRLDHIGIILNTPGDVDQWFEFLSAHGVEIEKEPKTHRDGARSFYCYDPDGTLLQMIYHPPLANT
ncbi:MAG: VOC family protein [Candidatus Oxydemutatoraceae bacterium WSBS_2016_MAG_OTU14]